MSEKDRGKVIPNELWNSLQKLTQTEEKLSVSRIFEEAADFVDSTIESYPDYKEFIKLKKDKEKVDTNRYLSYNVFKDFFASNKPDITLTRKKKLQDAASLMFACARLGYPYEKAHSLIFGVKDEEESYEDLLHGAWEVYYHHSNKNEKIRKTWLWLESTIGEDHEFNVYFKFRSKRVTTLFRGTGHILKDTFVLKIEENDKQLNTRFYFCSKLPSKHRKKIGSDWTLNVAAIANNNDVPVMGNVILVKNDSKNLEKYLAQGIYDVKEGESELADEIRVYLHNRPDRTATPFSSDDVYGVRERNQKPSPNPIAKRNYEMLKSFLKKKNDNEYGWYSFSRITPERNHITVFHWWFNYNDKDLRVEVERERLFDQDTSYYKGEFTLEWPHLYAQLKNQTEISSLKSVRTVINSIKDTELLTISATTYHKEDESSSIALREILCYLPKNSFDPESEKGGLLHFEKFLKLQGVSNKNKLYLSSRNLSTISFPSEHNYRKHFIRAKKGTRFAGEYYMLLRKEHEYPLTISIAIIKIDKLANVTMHINNYEDTEVLTYYGRIESYATNMHMFLEIDTNAPNEQKVFNIMFDIENSDKKSKVLGFSGVGIGTGVDKKNYGKLYPLILFKKETLSKDWGYYTQTISQTQANSMPLKDVLPKDFYVRGGDLSLPWYFTIIDTHSPL